MSKHPINSSSKYGFPIVVPITGNEVLDEGFFVGGVELEA